MTQIWVYLPASPLLWLTATLVCCLIAMRLFRLSGGNPLVNPVAIAVALLIGLLVVTGTPYDTYFDGAQFVHFLLGPATVALVPHSGNPEAVRCRCRNRIRNRCRADTRFRQRQRQQRSETVSEPLHCCTSAALWKS